MKGLAEQRIQKVINTELSYMQIHKKGFRQNSDFKSYMPDAQHLANEIRAIPNVTGASQRIIVQSMIASAETASGVLIAGVDPELESKVTNIHDRIIEGEYFEGIKKNPVVIGKKLAEKLNVKIKSKLVITLQDTANNVISGLFRVSGIYTSNNNVYDESHIFVRYDDLLRLSALPKGVAHEIAININDNENLQTVESSVTEIASGYEVLDWKSLSPEMNYLTEAMDLYMYIFIIIILTRIAFRNHQHNANGSDGTDKRNWYADGRWYEQNSDFLHGGVGVDFTFINRWRCRNYHRGCIFKMERNKTD